jgi:hypothetical protein
MVMALRHDRGRSGVSCSVAFRGLVELEAEQATVFVDAGQQQLPDGGLNGRFVNLPVGNGVTIV